MIDWGEGAEYETSGKRIYEIAALRPAVYIKTMVDAIFAFANFTYTSTFFDGSVFERLIMPLTKKLNLPDAQVEARRFKAVKVLPQILHRLPSTNPNTFGNEQAFVNSGEMAKLCFEDDSVNGFDNNNQYLILSTFPPFVPYNFNALNNYIFNTQEPQRNDTFRCSLDLQITKNDASIDTGTGIYEGTVEIVRWDNALQTLIVMGSSTFSWDISGAVGLTQTQTVFVEADVMTFWNDQMYIRMNSDPQANGYKSALDRKSVV